MFDLSPLPLTEVQVGGDPSVCTGERRGSHTDPPDDDGNCNVVLEMFEVYFSAAHILSRKAEIEIVIMRCNLILGYVKYVSGVREKARQGCLLSLVL